VRVGQEVRRGRILGPLLDQEFTRTETMASGFASQCNPPKSCFGGTAWQATRWRGCSPGLHFSPVLLANAAHLCGRFASWPAAPSGDWCQVGNHTSYQVLNCVIGLAHPAVGDERFRCVCLTFHSGLPSLRTRITMIRSLLRCQRSRLAGPAWEWRRASLRKLSRKRVPENPGWVTSERY